MINFIGRFLNGLNDLIYVAPLLFWENELFKAFRKMINSSDPEVINEVKDPVVEEEKEEPEKTKKFGNDHARSLQRSHFNKSRISRVVDSYGITHTYDHRRKGFVLSIGKTMQFFKSGAYGGCHVSRKNIRNLRQAEARRSDE